MLLAMRLANVASIERVLTEPASPDGHAHAVTEAKRYDATSGWMELWVSPGRVVRDAEAGGGGRGGTADVCMVLCCEGAKP